MQFLAPVMLWGLLAVAIPILVHLFNFRRTRKIYFTNVAFLNKVEKETSSFRRIKELLILLSRILAIACLVLAFALPFIPSMKGSSSGTNSIYLDNSLSMQNTVDNKRFIDLAVIKIEELVSNFGNSINLQLLTNDFSPEEQFLKSAEEIKEQLSTVDFGLSSRSLQSISKRQVLLGEKMGQKSGNNFFLISDFQKSTTGSLSDVAFDSTNTWYVVPVSGPKVSNVFVDSVWLKTPFIREMQNNTILVKLSNSGTEMIQDMPIRLSIDGSQNSGSSIDIAAGGSSVASFNFSVKDRGEHLGEIRFDDQPMVFDNAYFFTLTASPAIRILHLYEERSPANYISKLYANDSLFQFESYNFNSIDLDRMVDYDLVLMEGLHQIKNSVQVTIKKYLSEGGSIALIPPLKPDSSSYGSFLGSYGLQVYPSQVKEVELQQPNEALPFFADVFEKQDLRNNTSVPKINPAISWRGPKEDLLLLKNENPFLSKISEGKGSLFQFASSLLPESGNFAEHAFFVPVLYKIAASSIKGTSLGYRISDESIVIPLVNLQKNAVYSLVQEQKKIVPLQRVQGNELLIQLPSNSELPANNRISPGFYEVRNQDQILKTIALNNDPKESFLESYTPEEIREAFRDKPNVKVFDDIQDGDFIEIYKQENIGKELWSWCILAALFFILCEILLIRFWKS